MTDPNDGPPTFPLYVRLLAVAYVLSTMIGPVGFVVLASLAGIRWTRQRGADEVMWEFLAGALACPALCAAYRTWFVNWGRRNWPDGKPTPPQANEP